MHDIQQLIIAFFSDFPHQWAVFFLSMMPVTELRAAIPIALTQFDMTPFSAFCYAVAGNTFMGAAVVLIVEPMVEMAISKIDWVHNFWKRYIERIKVKNRDSFEKWGALALITFIAIPLPMTGAFTGAVAASIFEVPFKKAVPVIFAGNAIAGLIVTGLTLWVGKAF